MAPIKYAKKGEILLSLKFIIIIYPITRWFEITEYNNKKATMICEIGRSYVNGLISMASGNHV